MKIIAWLHEFPIGKSCTAGRCDVIHDDVKEFLLACKPEQVEHYTIPLVKLEDAKEAEDNCEILANEAQVLTVENFALVAMMDWQPIETAPKDKKAKLVWVPESACQFCVAWSDGDDLEGREGWCIFGGGWREYLQTASMWRPLPARP